MSASLRVMQRRATLHLETARAWRRLAQVARQTPGMPARVALACEQRMDAALRAHRVAAAGLAAQAEKGAGAS
ncbi:MAG: hypothetical protein Q8S73_38495 [Deltaproteobacteria bacterium]|nr:hypothetical protein [Myxococcales bacterium]MDP3220054.1 hypothetical protein [Deltaproteobacteria bacterium]